MRLGDEEEGEKVEGPRSPSLHSKLKRKKRKRKKEEKKEEKERGGLWSCQKERENTLSLGWRSGVFKELGREIQKGACEGKKKRKSKRKKVGHTR